MLPSQGHSPSEGQNDRTGPDDAERWRDASGRLIVVSGPSGSGKSTLTRMALLHPRVAPRVSLSISATTRQPRPGELPGEHYFFLAPDEFRSQIDAGAFLEWAQVHGNYYGTPADWVLRQLESGRCVLLEIDVKGAMQVRSRVPSALLVFIHVGGLGELEKRLRDRGSEDEATLQRRLANARAELDAMSNYDIALLNANLDRSVQELAGILINHGCGCADQRPRSTQDSANIGI